jgi:N-acetylneuraminic acid mutarotase
VDRSNRISSVLAIAVLAALVAGCSPTSTPAPSPTPSAVASAAAASTAPAATPTSAPTATPVVTPSPTPQPAHWVAAGSMLKPRLAFPLITLQDGRVLAIGTGYNVCSGECSGFPGPAQASTFADLFDLNANTWAATKGLNLDRSYYSTVLLHSGKVLVSGGYADPPNVCYSSAKLFNPETNAWTQTKSLMKQDRCQPAGTVLQDGRALVVGGLNYKTKALSSAEVFDPSSESWTLVASMPGVRFGAQAVTLGNGKVLVAGGKDGAMNGLASSWLYDPIANKWSVAGALPQAPVGTLIALADGSAMMVGDEEWVGGGWKQTHSERFDPTTATWSKTKEMATLRHKPAVVLLAGGKVMVAGGAVKVTFGGSGRVTTLTKTAEIYDPQTDTWVSAPSMPDARENASATLLGDNSILVAGGDQGEQGEAATPGGFPIKVLAGALRFVP